MNERPQERPQGREGVEENPLLEPIKRRESWLRGKLSTLGLGAFLIFAGPVACSDKPASNQEKKLSEREQAQVALGEFFKKGGKEGSLEHRRLLHRLDQLEWQEEHRAAVNDLKRLEEIKTMAEEAHRNYLTSPKYQDKKKESQGQEARLRERMKQAQRDVTEAKKLLTEINDREPLIPFAKPMLLGESGETASSDLYTGPLNTASEEKLTAIAQESGYMYRLVNAPDGLGLNSDQDHIVKTKGHQLDLGVYKCILQKIKPGTVDSKGKERHIEETEITISILPDTAPQRPVFENSTSNRIILYSSEYLTAASVPRELARIKAQENMTMSVHGLPDEMAFDAKTGQILIKSNRTYSFARDTRIVAKVTIDEIQGSERNTYPIMIDVLTTRPAVNPILQGGGRTLTLERSQTTRGRLNDTYLGSIQHEPSQSYQLQVRTAPGGDDISDRFTLNEENAIILKKDAELPQGNYDIIVRTNIIEADGQSGPENYARSLNIRLEVK